mmetsp:Transcript_3686/g.8000  ORF Transcript_3686/g.8000 Transcript_3686/m.8000 type:complete len:196 (+) Transcript_3686:37-624(+)
MHPGSFQPWHSRPEQEPDYRTEARRTWTDSSGFVPMSSYQPGPAFGGFQTAGMPQIGYFPMEAASAFLPTFAWRSRTRKLWSEAEHALFLQGLEEVGRGDWKSIAARVKSRTPAQVASHARKYFLRLQKEEERRPQTENKEEDSDNNHASDSGAAPSCPRCDSCPCKNRKNKQFAEMATQTESDEPPAKRRAAAV